MGKIIYWIDTKDGYYVGKLSNKYYMDYHLEAADFNNHFTSTQYRWEIKWQESLKQTGFKNDKYINSSAYLNLNEIKTKITSSLENYTNAKFLINGSRFSLYEAIKVIFGKSDLETIEALCIVIAAQTKTLLNTQIDFLERQTLNPDKIFSANVLLHRFRNVMEGTFNIGFRNLKNYHRSDFKKDLSEDLVKIVENSTGMKVMSMNNTQFKELLKAIVKPVQASTIKDARNTLKNIIKVIKGRRGIKEYRENLKQFSKKLDSYEGKTAGELYDAIYQLLDTGKELDLQQIANKNFDAIKTLSDTLIGWVKTQNIDDLFCDGHDYDHEHVTSTWKKNLSNYIAAEIFGEFTLFDGPFMEWQQEKNTNGQKQIDYGGKNYQWFYIHYASEVLQQDLPSLYNQSLSKVISKMNDNSFLIINWHKIYREQVALWLSIKDDLSKYANYKRFVHIDSPEQIRIY